MKDPTSLCDRAALNKACLDLLSDWVPPERALALAGSLVDELFAERAGYEAALESKKTSSSGTPDSPAVNAEEVAVQTLPGGRSLVRLLAIFAAATYSNIRPGLMFECAEYYERLFTAFIAKGKPPEERRLFRSE